MKIDLHCHSNLSDGALPPAEVVARAHANGVEVLALTDHDTVAGVPAAAEAAATLGMKLIPGIEFSSQWGSSGVHIVGLGMDTAEVGFTEVVARQGEIRIQRAREIAHRLEKRGISDSYEGAAALAGSGQIGRPHFARYLVEQGVVKNFQQAFKKYLGAGKTGDVRILWPEIGDVVGWIADAGGQAVLAHPGHYKLTRTKLKRLTADFADVGGHAIEVISGPQQPEDIRFHTRLAEEFELKASCGSDFHTPDYPWNDLGKFPALPEQCSPVYESWT